MTKVCLVTVSIGIGLYLKGLEMSVGWQMFLSEDQRNLLSELYDNSEKLANAQIEYMRLKKVNLQNPTPQSEEACKEHASMFIEKLVMDRQDVIQRLLVTAVDQEKLNRIPQEIQPLLKERMMPKLGALLLAKGGTLIGALAAALVSQDTKAVQSTIGDTINFDLDTIRSFFNENLRDISPMIVALFMDAVNIQIVLEVLDAMGAPSDKTKELIDKYVNKGVPRGH